MFKNTERHCPACTWGEQRPRIPHLASGSRSNRDEEEGNLCVVRHSAGCAMVTRADTGSGVRRGCPEQMARCVPARPDLLPLGSDSTHAKVFEVRLPSPQNGPRAANAAPDWPRGSGCCQGIARRRVGQAAGKRRLQGHLRGVIMRE